MAATVPVADGALAAGAVSPAGFEQPPEAKAANASKSPLARNAAVTTAPPA